MQDIKLNFINRSNDINKSKIVIFQKNVATDFEELTIAWKVIENCGRLGNHPFTYPMEFKVCSSDAYGNHTAKQSAFEGRAYAAIQDSSGDVLTGKGTASSPNQVELHNDLLSGAINANIYKDGKLLAAKTDVVPGQKAIFQFEPRLYLGVVSEETGLEEGSVMRSAVVQEFNTELDLFGIQSADIVLTGGGAGKGATSYRFQLENINKIA